MSEYLNIWHLIFNATESTTLENRFITLGSWCLTSQNSYMEVRTIHGYLVALSLIGVLLTAGCTSFLPSSDDQAYADAYPRSPLEIVSPIRYQGTVVNESGIAVAMLILNLTVALEVIDPGTSEHDPAFNITPMYVRYTDSRDLYTLGPGEYSFSRQKGNGGEFIELILPLRQPVPENTTIHADFWIPYQGTLTFSFRTPDVIEPSGEVAEFTTAPFVPH